MLTLAFRDDDRTPVIFAIREMAKRYYDLDVRIVKIQDEDEYEAALFNGSADVLIEHLEYLYEKAANGKKVTFFCAPSKGGGLDLVVPQSVQSATLVRDREKSVEIMRKYMRNLDTRLVQGAYERYKEELDRVPMPSEKAIKNTLEISHRVAPKLATIDINRHMYFAPVQRLVAEGFIDRLYK